MPNRIEEWLVFFSEFFELLDERPFAHTSMMFLFPRDHSEGMSRFEPSVGDELNSPVTSDENAVVLRRIFEQPVVIRSLGEGGNRALDVPTSLMQAVNELLADVGVREEWKPNH